MTSTLTNLNLPYYTDGDPASEDVWRPLDETIMIAMDSELATKTFNQSFADYTLSRPILKDYGEKVYAHGSVSGAVTVDVTNGNHQTLTLTGNVTLTVSNPTPTGNFCLLALYITQDATGGRTVTFPSACKNTSGSTFSISGTTASKMTEVFLYTVDAGTTWRTRQGETWT